MPDLTISPTSAVPVTGASFAAARHELHRVAVHILARARIQACRRFSLRITPGGFATPDFDLCRIRVADGRLLVESDAAGAARATALDICGATLRELAACAGVDLDRPLDVGHDTPPIGDPDAAIEFDDVSAAALGDCYGIASRGLDRVLADLVPAGRTATLPRLWPEHFDVAIETEARAGVRVNLGASPGDRFCDRPYWYVAPWSEDRQEDRTFWNAPFGAFRQMRTLERTEAETGRRFLLDGLNRVG